MDEQIEQQSTSIQRPITSDPKDWCIYWGAVGQPWRTMPEIDIARQGQLTESLTIVARIEEGTYPFKDVKLTRADIEWLLATRKMRDKLLNQNGAGENERGGLDLRGADLRGEDLSGLPLAHIQGGLTVSQTRNTTIEQRDMAGVHLEGCSLIGAHLEGACLQGAHLEKANLIEAHLEEAFLYEAHLDGANLYQASLHGANLSFACLEKASLIKARLDEADLSFAHLEKSLFSRAYLRNASLVMAHLEGANLSGAHLEGTQLQRVSFDNMTILEDVILSNKRNEFASLANVRWNGVNLTAVDWSLQKMLGDEYEARRRKMHGTRVKEKTQRLREYKAAVHANRQLSLVLRDQGLNEEADHFAYRANLLQRVVWRRQHKLLKYAFSWFLYLLAGYGYRPLRTLFIYLFAIICFASGYYWATHMLHVQTDPLTYYQSMVLSISSFHGRGFFQPLQNLGDPIAFIAALEAVFGLLIEISFIATFTQRYFGR